MNYRQLLALAVTLCGCVRQQTVSRQASTQAEFPAEERTLAENFLKALYRPEQTRYSIVIAPDVGPYPYVISPRELKADLRDRLRVFREIQGDITVVLGSDSQKSLFGKFMRSSGSVEYTTYEKHMKGADLSLEVSAGSIKATYTRPPRYAFISHEFRIRSGEQSFRFVTWAGPTVY